MKKEEKDLTKKENKFGIWQAIEEKRRKTSERIDQSTVNKDVWGNVRKINNKQTGKPSLIKDLMLVLSVVTVLLVAGFLAFKLVVGGFNYVSNMDFPSINLFGESEKDKKIKELEGRIKQLERKSNKSQSVVDELLNLQMLIETIGD